MSARAMRDSGVPWIGEIPAGWEVVRLGKLSESYCDGPFGSNLKSEHYVPEGVRVIRLQNVGACRFVDDDATYVAPEHYATLTRHGVRPGDIVVAGLGDDNHPVGRAFVVPASLTVAMVKADCFRFRIDRGRADATFVCWFLASTAGNREAAQDTKGSTRLRINLSGAARVRVPLPPLDEQRRIAAFLDARTAAIDAAVAEHENALAKLAEQRQSLISRVITRGLDPSVPVVDRGVEALGPIPRHWKLTELRRLVDPMRPITYGIVLPGENVADGVHIIKSGDCTRERLRPELLHKTTRDIESKYARSRMRAGDLVISIRGTVGLVALVPESLHGANLTQDTARIAPLPHVDRDWLLSALQSAAVQNEIAEQTVGATVRGLNLRELRRLAIPLPPLDEQRAIVAHLRERTAAIDAAADAARRAIALLREYRQSLVTAAVTGRLAPEEPRA